MDDLRDKDKVPGFGTPEALRREIARGEIERALAAAEWTVRDLEAREPLPAHERQHLGQARRRVTVLKRLLEAE
jgi:hypothetical protein